MKKLISTGITILTIAGMALSVFASPELDKARELLHDQAVYGSWDLLGMHGEKLYFTLRDQYAAGNPLKVIAFDIQMIPQDIKGQLKAFSDNDLIYMWFGGLGAIGKLKGLGALLRFIR
jgi:hypothetical protein